MKLVVGLGNPGKEYQNTRHNLGFMAIDNYVNKNNIKVSNQKDAEIYEVNTNGNKLLLLKPLKYINLSGEVIKRYADYYKIDINDILIIHDDMDTDCGEFKLKPTGGSAGHNGLKNIELNLGTKDYKRLKIGISRNQNQDEKDYVLGKLNDEEKKKILPIIDMTESIINDYLVLSFENLMNKYNPKAN